MEVFTGLVGSIHELSQPLDASMLWNTGQREHAAHAVSEQDNRFVTPPEQQLCFQVSGIFSSE